MKKIISLLALTALAFSAMAADVTWTAADGLYTNGANWGGTAPTDDNSTDRALLTGSNVELDIDRSVGGLDVSSATTLSGTGVLRIGPGASAGLGLTGSGDLTLTGGGGIQLRDGTDHALNYTGDITVGAGTTLTSDRHSLKLDTGTHADTTITLDGGTIHGAYNHLDMAGRNVVLTANGGTLFNKHARNFYNLSGQVISGVGQLTVKGEGSTASGRIELDNAVNTYTGGTRIESGGHIRANSDAALGLAGTSLTFNDGNIMASSVDFGTREFILEAGYGQIETESSGSSIRGAISGAGELIILGNGSGSVDMYSENNTYSGGTTVDGAQVNMRVQNGVFGTGDITLDNGGTIKNRNNNPTINNNIILGAGGGELESGWSNRSLHMNGVISGAGKLTVNNDSSLVRFNSAGNTYEGGTEIQGKVWAASGTLGTGDITLNNVEGTDRGHLQNYNNGDDVFNNNLIIHANGGNMKAGWNANLEVTGVVSGSGNLKILGDSGTVVLSNDANTYSGAINLQDATSKLSLGSLGAGATIIGDADATLTFTGAIGLDTVNGFAGEAAVASGGSITGSGSLAGNLTLGAGAKFVFSATDTLTVGGTVTLDSTFGVDDLIGFSLDTAEGEYTLIGGTSSTFDHIENFGVANAFAMNGGKSAYFENGSLKLTVIPEPATMGLLMTFGTAILFFRRRFII